MIPKWKQQQTSVWRIWNESVLAVFDTIYSGSTSAYSLDRVKHNSNAKDSPNCNLLNWLYDRTKTVGANFLCWRFDDYENPSTSQLAI